MKKKKKPTKKKIDNSTKFKEESMGGKEELKRALKAFKSFVIIAADNLVWSCLALFLLVLAFGALVFYSYGVLAEKKEFKDLKSPLQLEEKTYQEVLKIWQKQEEDFNKADEKDYPNLFERLTSEPEEEAGGTLEKD